MNPSSPYSNDSLENSLASQRIPKCARCRCHGINSELKGHKERCQFKDCECRLCLMVVERQKITAVRVAHLRHQRKVDKQRSSKYYTRYAPLSEEEDYVLSNYGGNEQARKHRMLAYDYPQYRHYNGKSISIYLQDCCLCGHFSCLQLPTRLVILYTNVCLVM